MTLTHFPFQLIQKYELKILQIIWLFLPAALANIAPVLASYILPNWTTPIDFGLTWNKRRILGDHKTYRGFFAAIVVGFAIFIIQKIIHWNIPWMHYFKIIDYDATSWAFGAWLGFCAISADLIKSFFKRRIKIPPGQSWIPFDEIDWIVGSLLGLCVIFIPSLQFVLATFLTLTILDFLVNWIAFKMGLKEKPI